jgi:heme/copper-type cytochrome/quinol oxidase subunit 2
LLALNLTLIVLSVAAFVWWAVTYEEDENHKETRDHKRKSRKISLGVAVATVAWVIVNLIVYST